jgi:hypothetical protein
MKQAAILLLAVASLQMIGLAAVQASERKQFQNYFDEKLSQVESALTAQTASPDVRIVDINFDLVGQVSFGLSDVLKLSVSTEFDFVFVPVDAP